MLGMKLISGIMATPLQCLNGALATVMRFTRRNKSQAPRPIRDIHYRPFWESLEGRRDVPGVDVFCPDGHWRRFIWITNTPNPLSKDGKKIIMDYGRRVPITEHVSLMRFQLRAGGRQRLAMDVFWMSDKFIGPPANDTAMSVTDEVSLRNAPHIGVYTLDPYCREANAKIGHPWHGRSFCNILCDEKDVDLSWADKFNDLRLLPYYDTIGVSASVYLAWLVVATLSGPLLCFLLMRLLTQ